MEKANAVRLVLSTAAAAAKTDPLAKLQRFPPN